MLFVAAYAVSLALVFTATSAQQIPPNRGDLTVAEFVENYTYYAELFDINFGNHYLDENGKWAEKDFDGTIYIDYDNTEMPAYNYKTEHGYVTGVSFEVELKNNQVWFNSYDAQMILLSLSFAGAQDEMGLFSKAPSRIIKQITGNGFHDFNFTEAGIALICNTEYSGYIEAESNFLFPEENVAETYFSLDFSMNKLI